MRKTGILLAAALLSVLMVSTAFAQGGMHTTGARLQGMGLTNFQTLDEFNIWINPAFINMHKNRVLVSLGTEDTWNDGYYGAGGVTSKNDDGWGGVNFETKLGTWGLYYGRPYDGMIGNNGGGPDINYYNRWGAAFGGYDSEGGAMYLNGIPYPHAPQGNFDLFYGKDLGGMLFGARLNFNMYKNNHSPDPSISASANFDPLLPHWVDVITDYGTTSSSGELNLVAGVFLKAPQIGISAMVGLPCFETSTFLKDSMTYIDPNTVTGITEVETADLKEKLKSDGAINFGLYADKLAKMSDKSTLFVTGFLQHMNNSAKKDNTVARDFTSTPAVGTATADSYDFSETAKMSDKMWVFGLDAALNYHANPSTLIIGTAGITYFTEEEKWTDTINTDVYTAPDGTLTFNPSMWFPGFYDNYLWSYHSAYGVRSEGKWQMNQWDIPLNIAVEYKVAKWLTTRLGVKKSLFQRTETKETSVSKYVKPPATVTVPPTPATYETNYTVFYKDITSPDLPATVSTGFTINFTDNFSLTAVLNYDVLFSGTYMVSGNRTYDALNTTVEVAYNF